MESKLTDVFISYSRVDRHQIEKLDAALDAEGFEVWWDKNLTGGTQFKKEIEAKAKEAKAIVVAWSAASIESMWVADEATIGRDKRNLIPICIDDVEAPIGFRQIQNIDFVKWKGSRNAQEFAELCHSIRQLTGGERPPLIQNKTTSVRLSKNNFNFISLKWAGGAIFLLVATLFAASVLLMKDGNHAGGSVDSKIAIGEFEILFTGTETDKFSTRMQNELAEKFSLVSLPAITTDTAETSVTSAKYTLNGTIDKSNENYVVNLKFSDRQSGVVFWSTKLERSVEDQYIFLEQAAWGTVLVLDCALKQKSKNPEKFTTKVFSLAIRYCEAASSGNVSQFQELPNIARQIIDVAPDLAYGYSASAAGNGYISTTFDFKSPEAEEYRTTAIADAERALKLDPNNGQAYWGLALANASRDNLIERERLLKLALQRDPNYLYSRNHLGHLYFSTGRLDLARDYYQRFASTNPLDRFQAPKAAQLSAMQGRPTNARRLLEDLLTVWPNSQQLQRIALENEILYGDPIISEIVLERFKVSLGLEKRHIVCLELIIEKRKSNIAVPVEVVREKCGQDKSIFPSERIFSLFGYVDIAFELLHEKAHQFRYHQTRSFFFPEMQALRADTRFMDLAQKYDLVKYWLETDQWPDFCKTETIPYDCKEAARRVGTKASGG